MYRLRAFSAGLAGLLLLALPATATVTIDSKAMTALNAMRSLNLIVLNDYTAGHEVEGKVWVGGNVTGQTFNVGIGNVIQGSGTSTYSTLTVGGNLGVSVNVNNGAMRSGTAGTGAYGVTVAGNVNQQMTFNGSGSVNTIGGNLNADENIGANAVLSVAGYAKSISGTGATTIRLGSDQGIINVGVGSNVSVHAGGVSAIMVGDGSTVKVGGDVASLTTGRNTTTTVTGTLGSQNFTTGSGSTTYANAYGSQNMNWIDGQAYINGSDPNPNDKYNGAPAGWHFSQSQALSAPDAPAPFSLGADKVTMAANMTDLAGQLSSLSANSSAVRMVAGSGIYDELFTVLASTSGAAVLSISAAELFGARNIGFNLNNYTGLVVINVTGIKDGTFNFLSGAYTNGGALWGSSLNEQLVWNFADATSASTLNFNNAFHGSILDPSGTVTNSTAIEGSVVASVFKQGGEVHLGTLAGDASDSAATGAFTNLSIVNTAPVPEPATWSTMILGFGVIGWTIRRRRALNTAAA